MRLWLLDRAAGALFRWAGLFARTGQRLHELGEAVYERWENDPDRRRK